MNLHSFFIHQESGHVMACYRSGQREIRKIVGKNYKIKAKAKFTQLPLTKAK